MGLGRSQQSSQQVSSDVRPYLNKFQKKSHNDDR